MTSLVADLRFAVPPLPPRHVTRPRLLDGVDDGADRALTLLCAGPGTGKTVLLSEWARRHAAPVVWLALTPGDDDPRRFWRLLLEGGRATGDSYPPSAWTPGRTVDLLDSVLGRHSPAEQPLTVVLDDAHVLRDPQILEGLDRIVRRWSRRVRLLLAARSDPLLPLHRYRVEGQVRELRAADLAMTVPEARQLLDRHGVPLPPRELELLTARTEGWAAGLRLAALRMQGTESPGDFVALMAMDQGSIGEYLTEEVLARQSEPVRRLLVETSFLDEVTGPLADAVTGLQDSAAVLGRLARTNSFVIPVDAAQTTFRYHQLFREILRHLFARGPAPAVRSRYARAAEWYRAHGDISAALRWTIRSQDSASTRSLLARAGLAEAFVRRHEIADPELAALAAEEPAEDEPGDPLVSRVGRWAIVALTTEPAAAGAALQRLTPLGPEADAAPAVAMTAHLAELILAQKAGDAARVDRAAERLLTRPALAAPVEQVPGLRSAVLMTQARSHFTLGRLDSVEPLLHEALAGLAPDDGSALHLEILSMLAFTGASTVRPRHADEALGRALRLTDRHPGLDRPVLLDLAIARRAELDADWDAMGAAIGRVLVAGPVYDDEGVAAAVACVQASYLLARDEAGQAAALLRRNAALHRVRDGPLAVQRDTLRADAEILLGRPKAALRILEPHRRSQFAVALGVTAARAHLALGDPRRARDCTRMVLTTPSPMVNRRSLVDAVLCEAEINLDADETSAAALLERALQIADGEFTLPFVRGADTFAPIVSRHPSLATRWPAAPVPAGTPPSAAVRTPEPFHEDLTAREQAVLRLMVTSLSTQEIAGELCLSINTVKSHLASIYRKLSVRRRREAVARARALELI